MAKAEAEPVIAKAPRTNTDENSLDPNYNSERSINSGNTLLESSSSRSAGSHSLFEPGHEEREVDGFRLIRTLGQGGFAWVKQAKWLESGRVVALKFIKKPPYQKYPRGEKRTRLKEIYEHQKEEFETEVNCLLRLKNRSRYVIKLFAYNDTCEYPNNDPLQPPIDTFMLALELAPVGELFDVLFYPKKGLNEKLARTYMVQIFKGLRAIHKAGIIHRDMKPQNILLAKDYTLRITDFGSAYILSEGEENVPIENSFGTIGYRSPELERGMRGLHRHRGMTMTYNKSCDIFACGYIMFILLTGYPPFSVSYYSPRKRKKKKKGRKESCDLFMPIQNDDMRAFWSQGHCQHEGVRRNKIRELISYCIKYNPQDRWTVQDCLDSRWLKQSIYTSKELPSELDKLYKKVNEERDLNPRLDLTAGKSVVQQFVHTGDDLPAFPASQLHDVLTPAPPENPGAQPMPQRRASDLGLDLPLSPNFGQKTFSYQKQMRKPQDAVLRFRGDDDELDEAQKNMLANMAATKGGAGVPGGKRLTITLTHADVDMFKQQSLGAEEKEKWEASSPDNIEEVLEGAPFPPEIASLENLPRMFTYETKKNVQAYRLFKLIEQSIQRNSDTCKLKFNGRQTLDSPNFSFQMQASYRDPEGRRRKDPCIQISAYSYRGEHTLISFDRLAGGEAFHTFLRKIIAPIKKYIVRVQLERKFVSAS